MSRQLGQSSNLSNSQEETRAKKKLKAQASVAELEKLCSFSPRINSPKRFSTVNSYYKQGENILEKIENTRKEKISMISDIKTAEEQEKNQICTFKPKTLPRIRSDSNIQVKGTDRFHELRGMARKQQIDKEQREKKLLYRGLIRDLIYSPYS